MSTVASHGFLHALAAVFAAVLAMALRRRHGTAAKHGVGPVVEVPPADELRNADVPAPAPAPTRPVARRPDGKLDGSAAARALSDLATIARREKRAREVQFASRVRLATNIDLFQLSDYAAPFAEEMEKFFQAYLAQLGSESDTEVSPAVAAIARGAAWQIYLGRMVLELATSRGFTFVPGESRPTLNTALMLQGSRLQEAGRQALLAAHHLQQLEAEARARKGRAENPAGAAKTQLSPFYAAAEAAERDLAKQGHTTDAADAPVAPDADDDADEGVPF